MMTLSYKGCLTLVLFLTTFIEVRAVGGLAGLNALTGNAVYRGIGNPWVPSYGAGAAYGPYPYSSGGVYRYSYSYSPANVYRNYNRYESIYSGGGIVGGGVDDGFYHGVGNAWVDI
ncbi:hypothetical protein AB6A40_003981 [Gnathostoma spinigerum]|uniref:Uncharacterized protein n=1 Tax=Gnathostoma spinigerum TaxID=75299 RepID=A0ABD6EL20_9BILA